MPKLFQPEEHRLSNGIPLILQHYDGPVATTYWWIQTGSADERQGEEGFAHFLEHMLFKDAAAKETGRASTGKMARVIESLGGDINAYTSFDQTVYHVTCAAPHWERVIDAFGTMAKPQQRFLREDFEREREVILEELRKNEDSPGRQLFQELFTRTFKKHPYGRPVIGYVKTLNAARVARLEAFYRRQYVAGRMGLILVGPIEDATGARKKALLKALENRFGKRVIPAKKAGASDPRPHDSLDGRAPALAVKAFDVKTATLSLSFRVPDIEDEDMPALDLLSGILGMGELSRLYQRLFYGTSLATEVSGGLYVPKDPGMLYFQAEVDSVAKLDPAAEEIFKELRRLAEEGPTPEELARVIVNAESERLYATQTADGMAGRLGFLRFVLGDLAFDERYLARLREVDAAKIREVARLYLDPRKMSAVALVPKADSAFDMTGIGAAAERILGRSEAIVSRAKAKKSSAAEIPVELITLPSGMRVAYLDRPQSHVFSAQAALLGGLRMEIAHPVESPQRDWGSSYLLALTWTKGAGKLGAREIARIVEGSAASIDGFSGRNTVGLQMTGLARDWGKLSELFSDVLLDPTFPDDELAHSRRVAEDAVRTLEDHSSQLCSKLFLETLYERHPYGRLTTGSLESLAAIDRGKLVRFHDLWMQPERMVVAVSGAIGRAALEPWLAELDRRVLARKALAKPQALEGGALESEPPLKAPRWVEKNLKREQTHILVGGLGTCVTADDRFALRLLQTLLGGQSGRLFIELREKKSLAYTVSPVSFEGLERGYVGTYIACAPGKRDEAIRGIGEVLEKLAARGPTPAEISRAKEFFLGRRAMDLQSDSALASHYGLELLYGVPFRSEGELVRRIRAISSRQIQDVCRRYLVEPFQVTSVVG